MDENSIPLGSSTPNKSIDVEALAAGLIRELMPDVGNGEFTNNLMEIKGSVCRDSIRW